LFFSTGIKACIIDFTIARVNDEQGSAVFLDLKDDDEQFLGIINCNLLIHLCNFLISNMVLIVGTNDYQFDIYRMMRDCNR
jgi:hypothetical protein